MLRSVPALEAGGLPVRMEAFEPRGEEVEEWSSGVEEAFRDSWVRSEAPVFGVGAEGAVSGFAEEEVASSSELED